VKGFGTNFFKIFPEWFAGFLPRKLLNRLIFRIFFFENF